MDAVLNLKDLSCIMKESTNNEGVVEPKIDLFTPIGESENQSAEYYGTKEREVTMSDSHEATLHVPNEETQRVLLATRRGEEVSFHDSVEDLFDDLNS